MPVDVGALNAAVQAAADEATRTEGTEASAGVIIASIGAQITKAVTDALTADAAANQASIDAATSAIQTVVARYAAADDKLGAAIAANNPTPPPAARK